MAFSGLSSNELFTASELQRSFAELVRTLAPKENPLLDWLGDSDHFATNIKHEWEQDHMYPNFIVASTAINSAATATLFQVNALGLALSVGQLIENQSANPEVMQISSIIGANTIQVSRAYDGGTPGSLAPGGQLYCREMAGVEGADHSGADTRRLGVQGANTVGLFKIELAQSNTTSAVKQYGNNSWDTRIAKGFMDALNQVEKAVIRGVLNGTNSLGTTTTTRTMKGLRSTITTISSTVTASSFAANPHLYLGNVWQQIYNNGGAIGGESWAVIAGQTYFSNISDLNDTKVSDSQSTEEFKRVVRRYQGPWGSAEVFPSRVLPATELLLIPRERVQVVPLTGRSLDYKEMAVSGDNVKGLITGEYTVETYHESAMARLLS